MTAISERTKRIIERVLREREDIQGDAGSDARRLWSEFLRRYKWRIFIALAATAVYSLHTTGTALVGRFMVDRVFMLGSESTQHDMAQQTRLMWLGIGMFVMLWAIYLVCYWLSGWLIQSTGQRLVYELRERLHQKLQKLHLGYYERTPTGRIMSRVLDDVHVIQQWSTSQFVSMMAIAVSLAVSLVVLFYFSWKMAILVCLSLPLYAFSFYKLQPAVRRANMAARMLGSQLYGLSAERIAGIRVVKAFCREGAELRGFARLAFDALRVTLRIVYFQRLLGLVAGLITAVTSGFIVYFAMWQVRHGVITLGTALAFIGVLGMIFSPIATLTNQLTALQSVFVVLRRVFSLLDEPVEVAPGSISLQGMKGKIRFDHVTFSYPNQVEPALHDVDFLIRPGDKVAVMGPSGAGKTTLFNLLLRFYDPQQGEVRVGGVNLAEADTNSIRRHICMVQQEPTVFSGTLAENIMYGRLECTPSQVMAAARQAELHDFIMTLPHKYETEVGEGGVTLSGGQKQRLALATALLTQPEVLLLDDTTSALDAHTEARIRKTLTKVLQGRTSLIITQRVATARDCDRIIVLQNGAISQMGTHQELSQQEGFYREICRQQDLK
jgi:ABC-type multidrug transport system fused ATPase/permease subunit